MEGVIELCTSFSIQVSRTRADPKFKASLDLSQPVFKSQGQNKSYALFPSCLTHDQAEEHIPQSTPCGFQNWNHL